MLYVAAFSSWVSFVEYLVAYIAWTGEHVFDNEKAI